MRARSFLVSIKLSVIFAALTALTAYAFVHRVAGQDATQTRKAIDPKAWGENHAGKPIPAFSAIATRSAPLGRKMRMAPPCGIAKTLPN
jgi:hypothetical protein